MPSRTMMTSFIQDLRFALRMFRTLQKLWAVSPGFDPENVLVFYTGISHQRSSTAAEVRAVISLMNERLRSISGVEAATVGTGGLPFLGNTTVGFDTVDDAAFATRREMRMANYYAVGPDHFKTLRIPLVRG